ncbi:MAG: hypothetical protein FWH43_04285 [Endomicrobia bacterium]|nr:hypothetical protein [Endomicrobiia bacterium]
MDLNCGVGLFRASVYKIVAAGVFFAVLANVVNLGAFYRGNSIELNTAALIQSSELSKVFNKINLPAKAAGGLFKMEKAAGGNESESIINNDKVAVILQHNKKFSAEISKKNAYIPVNELKILNVIPIDTGQEGESPPGYYLLFFNNVIMILLLILLLAAVLPRGISVKNRKNINIFMHPVFM